MSFRRELLNVPNLLSLARLLLVPVFLWLLLSDFPWQALAILAFAGASDWFDGYFARRFNQVTKLGKVLDPAADRLYIFATLIGLVINGNVPLWLAVVIIARDVMLAGTYPILARHGYGPLPVHYLGKAGTFSLLYALPLLLLSDLLPDTNWLLQPLSWAFAYWGIGLYWWAGFLYVRQVYDLAKKDVANPIIFETEV